MSRLWLVARHEYAMVVRRRAFLLTTIGLPLLMVVIAGASILVAEGGVGTADPIGYVDLAGVIPATLPESEGEEAIPVVRHEDVESGREAVVSGEIGTLFVIPAEFGPTPQFDVYYYDESPGERVWERWNRFVRNALLADRPEAMRKRLLEGSNATLRPLSGREFREGQALSILFPVFGGMLFMFAGMMSSGYLLQAVVGEKENRTMEVLLSSVTPGELIGGKTVGLMGVSLTQLGIWIATGIVALIVALPFVGEVPAFEMPWDVLGVMVLFFLPSYAVLAGIMVAAGGAVAEARQAQAITGPLMLPYMLPLPLLGLILSNPGGIVVTVLTLFPLSSFLTVTLRVAFGAIPGWPIVIASWLLLVATAAGAIWLAAAVFRIGMLRYGQRLGLRQVMDGIRGRAVQAEGRA